MSTIRKYPFIESVIDTLTLEQVKTLNSLLDNPTANIKYSLDNLPADAGVYPCDFYLKDGKIYSSILVKNSTYTVVIAYHRFQDLLMFNVVNGSLIKVNEYLDINELRRIVGDELVEAGSIGSGSASEGQVATADGEGGILWKNPIDSINGDAVEEGDAVSLLGFDSEGNPVKDTIPEGIVVDDALNVASSNAVANSAVTEGINIVAENLSDEYDNTKTYDVGDHCIHENVLYKCKVEISVAEDWTAAHWEKVTVDEELKGKLGINSYSEGAGVGYADRASNIEPVSEDSGATQTEPFIMQGTGTDNNTAAVDTRPLAKLQEKRGNTVVVNQLYNKDGSSGTDHHVTFTNNNDGTWTVNGTATDGNAATQFWSPNLINGHYYLLKGCPSGGADNKYKLQFNYGGSVKALDTGNGAIHQMSSSSTVYVYMGVSDGYTANNLKFIPQLIDLTRWFGGNDNIPADLLSHPEHLSWYYNGSLAYNEGQLVNCDGKYLISTVRQLCDEVFETGSINNSTGQNEVDPVNVRSVDYNRCIPNTSYYISKFGAKNARYYFYDINKNFISGGSSTGEVVVSPANAYYFRVRSTDSYGATYKNDFTISLYYATGDGYDQHYAYEEPKVYDTGSEELLFLDVKTPSGIITHNADKLILDSDKAIGSTISLTGVKSDTTKIISKYGELEEWGTISGTTITLTKALSNGDVIQFELATPTTSQGTPFTKDIEVNDYGMMYWLNSSNELVSIPQGNKIFYPVDYVLFLDSLHKLTEGDAEQVVLKGDLSAGDAETMEEMNDLVDERYEILLENIGGALRHQLSGVDFANTAWVDLGQLSDWTYNSDYSGFVATVTGLKNTNTSSQKPNVLCPIYKTLSEYAAVMPNMTIYTWSSLGTNKIIVKNTTYGNDADTFKAAMKGILLAYEKETE